MKSGSDAFSGKLTGPEFPRTPMDFYQTMSGWPPCTRIMTAWMWPPSCPSVGMPHVMASTPVRRDRPWCSIQVWTHFIYIRIFVEKTFRMHEHVLSEMTFDDLFQWAMMSYVPCPAGWGAADSGRAWTPSSNWRLLRIRWQKTLSDFN